ncbi:MAG TPA: 16S rRNA (cytosine(967)-C(5))-methyltransferase RsmB [Clostridiales bacterium]|nr:16S rRNA (cytosine(967)-C(5))-methyltransferase RsmB [Clostridiales bacterium]
MDNPRKIVLDILHSITVEGAYSNLTIKQVLDTSRLSPADKALVTEMVYGTLRYMITIDYIIDKFVKARRISGKLKNILRLGIYQIMFMDKVPDFAACNESAKLARRFGGQWSVNFVNAVLRNVIRNRKRIEYPRQDFTHYLMYKYSYPLWMVSMWMDQYGAQTAEKICQSGNERPDLTLRVNTLKANVDGVIRSLAREGINCIMAEKWENVIVVKEAKRSIHDTTAYKQGWFMAQDPGGVAVSKLLDPKPGHLVIDLCSAPGGKTCHMAELMENKGNILAWDVHPHRLQLVKTNCRRMGVTNVEVRQHRAEVFDDALSSSADRVLADVPCSGLGIIRRKPEIKLNRTCDDIAALTDIQRMIINTAGRYLKPGGAMVYSTCTINKKENEDIVRDFLKHNTGFKLEGEMVQLFPHIDGTDGFFMAKLIRKD